MRRIGVGVVVLAGACAGVALAAWSAAAPAQRAQRAGGTAMVLAPSQAATEPLPQIAGPVRFDPLPLQDQIAILKGAGVQVPAPVAPAAASLTPQAPHAPGRASLCFMCPREVNTSAGFAQFYGLFHGKACVAVPPATPVGRRFVLDFHVRVERPTSFRIVSPRAGETTVSVNAGDQHLVTLGTFGLVSPGHPLAELQSQPDTNPWTLLGVQVTPL